MRNSCSDEVFYANKRLQEEEDDLRDRINNFYYKKVDLLDEIEKEKKDDPSKEILEVEEEVKICDPFRGFLVPDENGSIRKGSSLDEPKLCKFYSKGFCKYKEECHLSHAKSDCKEHIERGICNRTDCTNRHRQDCKFYNSKKGCERRESCAFLHRHMATKDPTKDNLNSSKEKYEINKLESFIDEMKKKVQEKDTNMDIRNSEILKLRKNLENKDAEIKEKETMIRNLEEDQESGSDYSEDEDERVFRKEDHENDLIIGHGHFGKIFEARDGMEEEAENLRREWRRVDCRK